MAKIVINKGPGLFQLPRAIVTTLWDLHHELFDEPLDLEYLILGGSSLEAAYRFAVERDGKAYFLKEHSAVLRQLPWLIQKVEAGELGESLKVIEIPDDVKGWHLNVWDDGTEVVHEDHRTFS